MTIKVLHLVHAFRAGGAERVIVNLVNHSSQHVKNIVGSFLKPDDFINQIHANRRDVRWLRKSPGSDWRLLLRLRKLISDEGIDIVHAQGWGTYLEGLISGKLAGLRAPKFIYAFHGKTIEDVQNGIPWKRRLAQSLAARFCDALIAPSQQMAKDYEEIIGLKPSSVQPIYNGVFLPGDQGTLSREDYDLPKEAWVIGFVGRLDPVKNLGTALNVLARLNQAKPEMLPYMLLVGDGPERCSLEARARALGIDHRVRFVGLQSRIAQHLDLMDAYFQPSHYEGHSCTILEAMCRALPVVSTKVGGTNEIITHLREGFLYDPDDEEGMLEALLQLYLKPSDAAAMGGAARAKVLEIFSVQTMVANYEELYFSLLG